jgi:glycosyltransferase involved in cell wall biosynthesis
MTRRRRRVGFLVWATPDKGQRSGSLARELDIDDIVYVHPSIRRTALSTFVRYPVEAARTISWLVRHRPDVVFVQHPPSPAAWLVAIYSTVGRTEYVLDCHSGSFDVPHWRWPGWLHRRLLRRASAVLVTDPHWAAIVQSQGGRPMVVLDPVTNEDVNARSMPGTFAVVVVNTWAPDEPIEHVVEAARRVPEADFYITGRSDPVAVRLPLLPSNVHFTGFLDAPEYLGLLKGADAVMCLTTRDHTMQRGAAEAMSLGAPVITSNWPLLRGHFNDGAVYVDATASSIEGGVRRVMDDPEERRRAILGVRERRRAEWLERRRLLRALIEGEALPAHQTTEGSNFT